MSRALQITAVLIVLWAALVTNTIVDSVSISSSSSANSGINFGNQATPPTDNITPAMITAGATLLGVVLTILATKRLRVRRR